MRASLSRSQTGLAISRPDDPSELEADRIANALLSGSRVASLGVAGDSPAIQRCGRIPPWRCPCDGELHSPRSSSHRQRASTTQERPTPEPPSVSGFGGQNLSAGKPLPDGTRQFFENRFGLDFRAVRVHDAARDASVAVQMGARAFTHGYHVVFAPSQYSPDSRTGRRLIAHELVHVMQQAPRPQSTAQVGSTASLEPSDRWKNAPVGLGADRTTLQSSTVLARTPDEMISVLILLDQNTIVFETTGGLLQYRLTSAAIPPGTYEPRVTIEGDNVVFVFATVPGGELFRFSYQIEAGQLNPARLIPRASVPLVVQSSSGTAGGEVAFSVRQLSPSEFHLLTGASPDSLPEGRLVTLEALTASGQIPEQSLSGPGLGPGAIQTPLPALSPNLPRYGTFAQWTQVGAGHLSLGTIVEHEPTSMRGFRGQLWRHAPGIRVVPELVTGRTTSSGIPGGFRPDFWFNWLPNQNLVVVETAPEVALRHGEYLRGVTHQEVYVFPAREGESNYPCPGRNCITVPRPQVERSVGGRPIIQTPEGPVSILEAGIPRSGGPPIEGEAGSGRTVRVWLEDPLVETPEAALERRNVVRPTGRALVARHGVAFIRAGGVILMIYGAYQTGERLRSAAGTPEFGRVAAQEAGAWAGGIIGSALGAAGAGAVFCSPTGPVTLVCAAAGFVGGLVVGYVGAVAGTYVADWLYQLNPIYDAIDITTRELMQSPDPQVRSDARLTRKAFLEDDPWAIDAWFRRLAGVW